MLRHKLTLVSREANVQKNEIKKQIYVSNEMKYPLHLVGTILIRKCLKCLSINRLTDSKSNIKFKLKL